MNKKLFSLLIGLAMVFAGLTLASCGSDDDEHRNTSQNVSFKCEANEALLAMADLTITYNDADGTAHTEALTGSFSKQFTVTKFPVKGSFKIKATRKEKIDVDKVKGKSPTLTYEYKTGLYTKPGSIMKMFVYTNDEVNDLISKINAASWDWEVNSAGTIKSN